MRVEFDFESLRKQKLVIATPAYGGQCTIHYTKSMCDLVKLFADSRVNLGLNFLSNHSLITRARNTCADTFMQSDATHLMFIDSDIGFNARDVLFMLSICTHDSPYDVLAAPYPMKGINWKRVLEASKSGKYDNNPEKLSELVGNYVFNPIVKKGNENIQTKPFEPLEVSYAGTGFMLIRRETFVRYQKNIPNINYISDTLNLHESQPVKKEIAMYFQAEIESESQRYLSEDYRFCHNVRSFGGQIWLCPWMKLTHVGTYPFEGNLLQTRPTQLTTQGEKPHNTN